jgi:hypothetical protein
MDHTKVLTVVPHLQEKLEVINSNQYRHSVHAHSDALVA